MPRRTATACDGCRQRKIRCDATEPSCDWCKHHNLRCTRTGVRSRATKRNRGPDSRTPMPLAAVKDRQAKSDCQNGVDVCNKILQPSLAVESQGTFTRHSQDESVDLLFVQTPGFSPRAIEVIEPQSPFCCKLGTMLKASYEPVHNSSIRMSRMPQLLAESVIPDRNFLSSTTNAYHSTHLSRAFPLLQRDLFEQSSKNVYDGSGTPAEIACVLAFMAFISLFGVSESRSDPIDYKTEALKFLPEVLVQAPTLEAVQTLLMLAVCSVYEGNVDAITNFIGLSTRMLFTLGGHKHSQSHARTLFWLCYAIDKEVCSNFGLPIICDAMCDLTLPENYEKVWLIDEFDGPAYPMDLRLSIIKSQVFDLLYSPQAATKSDAELLRHMRELDEHLENWRASLPIAVRPALSVNMSCTARNVHTLIMHLGYHDCAAKIHGAAVLGKSRACNQSSSTALCMGSCYSSLLLISSTTQLIKGAALWIVMLYSMAAMRTLCDDKLSRSKGTSDINISEALMKSASASISGAFTNRCISDEKQRSPVLGRLCIDLDLVAQSTHKKTGDKSP